MNVLEVEPGRMKRFTLPNYHPRTLIVVTFTVIALLVGFIASSRHTYAEGSTPPAAGEHIITLHDDGIDKGFITKKATLREALAEAHIRLDAKDRTEPGLDEPLTASSYQVNIYRARPVVVRDGASETKVVTSYRTPKQIATEANIVLHDEDIAELSSSTDPIGDGAAEVMTIVRATAFTFDFYGKQELAYTQAKTVGDMLKEKGIVMQAADGVSPAPATSVTTDMHVRLWRNGVQTVTADEEITFTTREVKDANQPLGYRNTQSKGENGKRTVTYEINMQNGVEVSRKEINTITTKQAVEQVDVIGTKVSLPAGSHEDWMAAAGLSAGDYGYANFIFGKESGWRPDAVSSNGYYGLGQTNLSKLSAACPNWQSDPICQIRLFNNYAVSRYGSWQGAYDFWNSHHWW